MKIHEYQAKEIMASAGLPVQQGLVAISPEAAKEAAANLGGKVVVKAQVQVGGRGKAGGVKLANNPDEAFLVAGQILGLEIKGITVKKVLLEAAAEIAKEFYVGITIDRAAKKIVYIVSQAGGIDIEEVAKTTPEKITKVYIDPLKGWQEAQGQELAAALFTDVLKQKAAQPILENLYKVFAQNDCSLAEINPLVETAAGALLAVDAKMVLDDNGLVKHPELEALRDLAEEEAEELEAKQNGLSYVKLEGDIGCIVNGAGLAMATMDMIKLFGGEPANFLDVGGSSSPDKIIKAFEIILRNNKTKAILINIFGGITRCDDIASGLLLAREKMTIAVPLVIRLAGTNAPEAREIISKAGLLAFTEMEEAVKKVIQVAGESKS